MNKIRSWILMGMALVGVNAMAISAPSITSCTRASSTSVKVSWTAVSDASYYVVRRSYTSSVESSSSIATPSGTSYTDSQAGADTCYYWVEAWDSSGASARSGMATTSRGKATASSGIATALSGSGTSYDGQPYTVKFNANGGTGTMANESFVYGTAKALTICTFTRTGYTFVGWAKSASATTSEYDDGQTVNNLTTTSGATVNLYAVWQANTYTVKFNKNGGTGTMANESFTYGTAKALTANAFQRVNYRFVGWATSASATTATYTDKQSVSNLASAPDAVVNLYAVWKLVLEITSVTARQRYPWNGLVDIDVTFAAGGLSAVSFEVKDTKGNTNLNARTFYVGNPSENNRTLEVQPGTRRFVWDAAADIGQVTLSSFAVTAKVVEKNFQVNVTGGTGSGSFVQGKSVTIAAAAKTGYTFASWSGAAADTALLASATATSTTLTVPSRDLAYEATYTPNTYTVKFNANGGSGTMNVESFTYDVSKALYANAFTLSGCTFLGWAENASATTAKYTDGQTVKNLITSGTKNLYAVWQHNGVQLWAGGPYWGYSNVGSTTPEGTGYYFWWGDTVGYKRVGNSWNAVDGSVTGFAFTGANCPTYNKSRAELQSAGVVDSAGNLVATHDAASMYWGLPWRMPTRSEIAGLSTNTTWSYVTQNGVNGILFTGKNAYAAKSIFIPLVGSVYDTTLSTLSLSLDVKNPIVWTSSLLMYDYSSPGNYSAICNYYGRYRSTGELVYTGDRERVGREERSRYVGMQIRPVRDAD